MKTMLVSALVAAQSLCIAVLVFLAASRPPEPEPGYVGFLQGYLLATREYSCLHRWQTWESLAAAETWLRRMFAEQPSTCEAFQALRHQMDTLSPGEPL